MRRSKSRGALGRMAFQTGLSAMVVVCSLLIVSSASAAGTLDQSQTSTSQSAVSVAGARWVSQTFTAGITGNLDQVDLFLFRVGSPGDLTVQIQAVSGGVPSGSVLASATVLEASVNQATSGANPPFSWVSVPFGLPAPVTVGTQYAIVLSAPSAPGGLNFYSWGDVGLDPYSGGRVVLTSNSGATWGDFAFLFDVADTAFKTYVTSLPSSLADCKNDGWRSFPQFKNHGDCVSFIATEGNNPPG